MSSALSAPDAADSLFAAPLPTVLGEGYRRADRGGTDVWLTPPSLLAALGVFDLDPCAAPEPRPWPTAKRHITLPEDGLRSPWQGRVWLNPPYSNVSLWLAKLAEHGQGTALVFARTETRYFQRWVWGQASALLFPAGRVNFCRPNGTMGDKAGAPSVFVAYGERDAEILCNSSIEGARVTGFALR